MSIVPGDQERTFESLDDVSPDSAVEPRDAVPPLVYRARESIRAWVRLHGRGVLGAAPLALAAALTAAALAPVAVPLLLGNAALALSGLLGQLGNIGAEHLANVIDDVLQQLRGESRTAAVTEQQLQAALRRRLRRELDGPDATALRAEMARLLHAVDGVGTALDAAVRSGVDGLYAYIGETVNLLSQTSMEFRILRDDVMSGLADIQTRLARIEAVQRGGAERVERISVQITALHRQLMLGRAPARPALEASPGGEQAAAGQPGGPDGQVCPYPGLAASTRARPPGSTAVNSSSPGWSPGCASGCRARRCCWWSAPRARASPRCFAPG